jgi:CheY-like chemotaxis protein
MHPATEKTTVLVVDDEAAVRAVVRTTLLRQGYEVLEAEDGVAAYELIQRFSGGIQLLVTDIDMPRMDGITLGGKLETDYPNIKVLYISGLLRKPPQRSPNLHLLAKPFLPDALVRCVRDLSA